MCSLHSMTVHGFASVINAVLSHFPFGVILKTMHGLKNAYPSAHLDVASPSLASAIGTLSLLGWVERCCAAY